LKFAQMPLPTPLTKHIGVPYHWLREQVEMLQIGLERIASCNQLAGQFTRVLPAFLFLVARKTLRWMLSNILSCRGELS
jgi:hypothetical protein